MIKQTIKFENFDGEEVFEDHYFNISKKKFLELEATYQSDGGFAKYLMKVADTANALEAMKAFELLVDASYGVRSPDGRRFHQSEAALQDFKASPAYDEFIVQLMMDPNKAVDFFSGTLPNNFKASLGDRQGEADELRNKYTSGEITSSEFEKGVAKIAEDVKKNHLKPVSEPLKNDKVVNEVTDKIRGSFGQTIEHESPEEKRARLQKELDELK